MRQFGRRDAGWWLQERRLFGGLTLGAALTLAMGPAALAQGVASATGGVSSAMPDASRSADVRYADGLLTVSANNAGLNAVLQEIAKSTGMRVKGTVRDERVFGTYGPATPSQVISMLLDGTGSNVLLVEGAGDRPRELVLTTRTGGASPPDPNASAARAQADDDEMGGPPVSLPVRRGAPSASMLPRNAPGYRPSSGQGSSADAQQQVGGVDQNPSAPNGSPSSTEQPVVFAPVDATTPPATASSTPQDNTDSTPKDAKTPQQIFEQLQRLRQQQTQQPGTTPQ